MIKGKLQDNRMNNVLPLGEAAKKGFDLYSLLIVADGCRVDSDK